MTWLPELWKVLGWGAVAVVVAYLFVYELIVSGFRFRRDEARHAEEIRRLLENGERWEGRYLEQVEVTRKGIAALGEAVELLKKAMERSP